MNSYSQPQQDYDHMSAEASRDKTKYLMSAAYSLDLRQKVMDGIDKGMFITTASNTFCFNRHGI